MNNKGADLIRQVLGEDLPVNQAGHLGELIGAPSTDADPEVRYVEIRTKYPATTLNSLGRAGLMDSPIHGTIEPGNPRLMVLAATQQYAGPKEIILEDLNEISL